MSWIGSLILSFFLRFIVVCPFASPSYIVWTNPTPIILILIRINFGLFQYSLRLFLHRGFVMLSFYSFCFRLRFSCCVGQFNESWSLKPSFNRSIQSPLKFATNMKQSLKCRKKGLGFCFYVIINLNQRTNALLYKCISFRFDWFIKISYNR